MAGAYHRHVTRETAHGLLIVVIVLRRGENGEREHLLLLPSVNAMAGNCLGILPVIDALISRNRP